MVSKKKEKKIFFFTFLNWENQTWYWEKRWLFLIGNGAKIRPPEMDRKSPEITYPESPCQPSFGSVGILIGLGDVL